MAGSAAALSNPGGATLESLRPSGPGATTYGVASAGAPAPGQQDSLAAAIIADIRRAARASRKVEPVADPRLDAVATDLARGLRGTDLPPFEVVEFLLGHYGLVEAAPHLLLARASSEADREVRDQLAGQFREILNDGRIAQVGAGVYRTGDDMAIVVALQEKNVDLAPVARTLPIGSAIAISGTLRGTHRRPEVIVTTPDGRTRELKTGSDPAGVRFHSDLRCDGGPGRYQIEVTGDDARGTAVVANFPVFCGVPVPMEAPTPAAATMGGPLTVDSAEARLLDLVNRDRRVARLPSLTVDRKLSVVARAHSQDMADHDFVGHISPTTGNALDRVRRAGFAPTLLAENVGRAYAPDEVHAGLMQSPGHRANILDPRVTRVGIGVVIGKPVTGTIPLLVTQLFM